VPHGKYLIDADISIKLKSHVTLQMVDSMAQLIAKPTNSDRYNVILIVNQTDVSIIGGKIIGDRDQHLGTTGEWGMGISVFGSNKVNISGTHISDCWGDGIIIGAQKKYNAPGACTFITIKNVVSDNNRRQGLSIEEVNNVVIDSCVFSNTHGTKPMDGIDIEPNGDSAQYINIKNCILAYNQGNGIEMNARSISSGRGTTIINIIVQHNYLHHNAYGGYLIRAKNVQFNYNKIQLNRYGPPIKAVDTVNCILAPNN
jgi:nitrous oxidase accessory protein NosD